MNVPSLQAIRDQYKRNQAAIEALDAQEAAAAKAAEKEAKRLADIEKRATAEAPAEAAAMLAHDEWCLAEAKRQIAAEQSFGVRKEAHELAYLMQKRELTREEQSSLKELSQSQTKRYLSPSQVEERYHHLLQNTSRPDWKGRTAEELCSQVVRQAAEKVDPPVDRQAEAKALAERKAATAMAAAEQRERAAEARMRAAGIKP